MGHFWASPQEKLAFLVAQGLPALASDQVYQVWLVRNAERTSGGVFEARNGSGGIVIRLDEPLAGYGAIGVTIEPRGGSRAPTGPRVLRGELTAAQALESARREEWLHLLAQVIEWGD